MTQSATQKDLIITDHEEPRILVDNIEVAQFVHLLLDNAKIRQIIDTITTKVVLILGRFSPKRKTVLDALRERLRERDWVPVLFDFEKPAARNFTETVRTVAHLARFIIADITDAKSVPQELQAIVPHLPHVPVQPLLESSSAEYGMFSDFEDYPWVLDVKTYEDVDDAIASLEEIVAEAQRRTNDKR